jgi:hypothetical protein
VYMTFGIFVYSSLVNPGVIFLAFGVHDIHGLYPGVYLFFPL